MDEQSNELNSAGNATVATNGPSASVAGPDAGPAADHAPCAASTSVDALSGPPDQLARDEPVAAQPRKKPAKKRGTKGRKRKPPITAAKREASRQNITSFNEASGGKQALKHGIKAMIRTGELPALPYAAEIRENVSALIDAAVVDLGGSEAITSMQRQILESSRVAITIVTLAARHLSQVGVVNAKTGKPQGLLHILASYLNTIRLNAETLGLERRARNAGPATLAEYLEVRARASAEPTEQSTEQQKTAGTGQEQ